MKSDFPNTPGVGQYDVNKIVRASSPNAVFSKTKRKDLFVNDADKSKTEQPGPGRYSNSSALVKVKSPSYKIGQKAKIDYNNNIPGPGQYDFNNTTISNKVKGSGQGGIISKSKRDTKYITVVHSSITLGENKDADVTPGPGRYGMPTSFTTKNGFKFSNDKRKLTEGNAFTPGPGNYETLKETFTSDKNKNKGYTISKTNKELNATILSRGSTSIDLKSTLEIPGPGRYNNQSCFDKKKTFKIGEKINIDLTPKTPGPGQYDLGIDKVKGSTPNCRFGNSKRPELYSPKKESITPGPGRYSIDFKPIAISREPTLKMITPKESKHIKSISNHDSAKDSVV